MPGIDDTIFNDERLEGTGLQYYSEFECERFDLCCDDYYKCTPMK